MSTRKESGGAMTCGDKRMAFKLASNFLRIEEEEEEIGLRKEEEDEEDKD